MDIFLDLVLLYSNTSLNLLGFFGAWSILTTALQPGELRHAWSTGELALMEQFNNLLIAALLLNYALSQATVSGTVKPSTKLTLILTFVSLFTKLRFGSQSLQRNLSTLLWSVYH